MPAPMVAIPPPVPAVPAKMRLSVRNATPKPDEHHPEADERCAGQQGDGGVDGVGGEDGR
ncbi:hypothetical protein ACLQ22_13050 [Micromonospora sp. DT178]|uniref:hypothetical protein n=1 Tax=Micromonospora sp. DT178 TaxID=3393436 RepID=UPI003CEF613F